MSEAAFIASIDCAFPYFAPLRWRRMSARAARTSPNAAFAVVHELCRPPRSVPVPAAVSGRILMHLYRRFRHPLRRVLNPAVQAHLSGALLSESHAASLMRKIAAFPGQYCALAICYFSADDRKGTLDCAHSKVVREWERGKSAATTSHVA